MRTLLVTLATALLLAPFALAGHTPPANDQVDGGKMGCDAREGHLLGSGAANSQVLPLLRTTDNGHLVITANGSSQVSRDMKCLFEVVITGHSLVGIMPQGGLNNVASTPCSLSGVAGPCMASASADWWVTFVGVGVFTSQIDVHFDLRVNGVTVDSGTVSIVEPSVPALPHF